MRFPERVYTVKEVEKARELIRSGYRHRLTIKGNKFFKQKVRQALKLVKTAGYYNFLRAYIHNIVEIDGLTQLREAEASIWVNKYTVETSVDAASLFIQKAHHMKEYIEGELYYGGEAEERSIKKRIEFLEALKKKSRNKKIKKECEKLLKSWGENVLL